MRNVNIFILLIFFAGCSQPQKSPIIDRLQPAPKDAGFKMDGYFIWGGSLIFADGKYHLFASRWPTWQTLGIEWIKTAR